MRLAIVHDSLATAGGAGGAEAVLRILHGLFPEAPIYTTVYNQDRMPPQFREMDIRTSFIQKLPFAATKYKLYLPLMPTAIEQFDLREYDVVLSCNHSVAKGVITTPDTLHLCYCYTPMRYAWDFYQHYLENEGFNWAFKQMIPFFMNYIRQWDVLSASRVDYFASISHHVAHRIHKHYRRDSEVIYPPVDTSLFQPTNQLGDFFLIVSRMVSYKRLDIVIDAFNQLGLPLIVIGNGPERKKLESIARANIRFLGRQGDQEVRQYYARCQAFIVTADEDFGITALEAQASGRPVIAFGKGGSLETVIDNITGVFFEPQTSEALIKAMESFNPLEFDPSRIREHALKFDRRIFEQKIQTFIHTKYSRKQESPRVLTGINS